MGSERLQGKRILILGGGVGGIVTANTLGKLLPAAHQIILVEKNAIHDFAPSFLWLMHGTRQLADIRRPLKSLLHPRVEVLQAEAKAIDTSAQRVVTNSKDLDYDILIIALGADLAPETVPGLAQSAHTYYTLEGAERLGHALKSFDGGRVALVVAATPYKCPGAPHEGAMLMADVFQRRGVRQKADLHLFTPEPQPMPVAGPELGKAVMALLESKSIFFHPLHKLASVHAASRELLFEGKESFRYDLLVAIPPHRAPRVILDSGLADKSGWISVDRQSMKTINENIYAIGDVTAIPIPGRWRPDVPLMLPKAGVFAHAQAHVVAHRVAAEIAGTNARHQFGGEGYCMLEAGEDLAGFAFGDFFAEPSPDVRLKEVGRAWHLGKIMFEKWWLSGPGMRHDLLGLAIKAGAKTYGVPAVL
jgi:sulfide:quinone oxidoreductase